MSASGLELRLIKTCRLTGSSIRSRNGRFSSWRPPRTPGLALTIYFSMLISAPPLLFAHYFFHPFNNIRRLMNNLPGEGLQPLSAHWIDLPLPFCRFSHELWILEHFCVGFAE